MVRLSRVVQIVAAVGLGASAAVAAPLVITRSEGIPELVTEEQAHALSIEMHDEHDRCGGYIVHASIEEAMEPAAALRPAPAYTIDRGPAVQAAIANLRAPAILATIKELTSFKNRYWQSESGAAASHWLRDRWLHAARLHPRATVELVDHGYPQKSVVLTIRGTTKPHEIVVIGGHLDSIGRGGKDADAPGADDDASGIATLDAVAQVLLERQYEPERTIQFMAYAAEEVGLRGSMSIARDYKKRDVNVVGALQLDMTNYQGSDRDIWFIDDFTSKAQNAFLVKLVEHYTAFTWGSTKCGYACSDHASWNRAGYHASAPHETRSADRNRAIHTHRDTLEVSGENAAHAYKFAVLAAAYTIELGKGTLGARAWSTAQPKELPADDTPAWPLVPVGLALVGLAGLLGLSRRWP